MNRQGTILRTIPSFMDELQHRSQTQAFVYWPSYGEATVTIWHLNTRRMNWLRNLREVSVCVCVRMCARVCVCRSDTNGINMCNNGANPSQLSQYASAPYELPLIRAKQDSHISWIQMIFLHVFLLISRSQSRRLSCTSPSVECQADIDVRVSR